MFLNLREGNLLYAQPKENYESNDETDDKHFNDSYFRKEENVIQATVKIKPKKKTTIVFALWRMMTYEV